MAMPIQGALLAVLAAGLVWISLTGEPRAKNIALAVFLGCFAVYFLSRSLSREKSREDKMEEREERNRLAARKANSRAARQS